MRIENTVKFKTNAITCNLIKHVLWSPSFSTALSHQRRKKHLGRPISSSRVECKIVLKYYSTSLEQSEDMGDTFASTIVIAAVLEVNNVAAA